MTIESIEQFVESKARKNATVQIHFKERDTVKGLFIRSDDYEYLKDKNLWRIVHYLKIEEWNRTKNTEIPKIFSGVSFTRLTEE